MGGSVSAGKDLPALMRRVLLKTAVGSGLLPLYQRAAGRQCTVLLYHSVGSGQVNPYLDTGAYLKQMHSKRSSECSTPTSSSGI